MQHNSKRPYRSFKTFQSTFVVSLSNHAIPNLVPFLGIFDKYKK